MNPLRVRRCFQMAICLWIPENSRRRRGYLRMVQSRGRKWTYTHEPFRRSRPERRQILGAPGPFPHRARPVTAAGMDHKARRRWTRLYVCAFCSTCGRALLTSCVTSRSSLCAPWHTSNRTTTLALDRSAAELDAAEDTLCPRICCESQARHAGSRWSHRIGCT